MKVTGGPTVTGALAAKPTVKIPAGLAKPTKIYPVSDGFGLGVEIRTDVARAGWLGSEGTFGWNGASTCYCAIDPKERLVMMIWAQHSPNAEFGLYERFNTLVYQAQVH